MKKHFRVLFLWRKSLGFNPSSGQRLHNHGTKNDTERVLFFNTDACPVICWTNGLFSQAHWVVGFRNWFASSIYLLVALVAAFTFSALF